MTAYRFSGVLGAFGVQTLDAGTLALGRQSSPGILACEPTPVPPRQWYRQSRPGGFPAATLTMSPEAVDLLQGIEELRLRPYDDQTGLTISRWVAGATIGYGHLIAEADWDRYKDGLTAEAANTLFLADALPFELAVGEVITVGVQQYEFDALVILAFNIGAGAFRNSSVARLVNDPDAATGFASLEAAWKAWNKSQGQVMRGLENRRAAEWRMFSYGLYERW